MEFNTPLIGYLLHHTPNSIFISTEIRGQLIAWLAGDAIQYIGDANPHTLITLWLDGVPGRIDASNTTQIQQPLWSKRNLGPGDHQLVIRHEGLDESPVTLDFLRIEYEETYLPLVSGPAASIVPPNALIMDDTRLDLFEYSPPSAWNDTTHSGMPYNSSLHATTQTGAAITFKFNGTAVWYFADTDINHGKMHITLDGKLGTTIVGFSTYHLNQRLLWSATDLADGEHTVVVAHADTDGKFMTVDFFRYLPSATPETISVSTVTSTVVVSHPPTTTSRPTTTGANTNPNMLLKAMAGGILGGLALFILLGVFVYLCYRFKRSRLGHLEGCKPDYPSLLTVIPRLTSSSTPPRAQSFRNREYQKTQGHSCHPYRILGPFIHLDFLPHQQLVA
ncbi:hypothetical protein FRC08_011582 [Ceratobasidium sp. 394]|nr:hypothetical protein FRC08_011582 [Ceratobasidium sp. 394]